MRFRLRPSHLVLLPFGVIWFALIANVQVEWSNNEQYAYGWAVPVLCVGLVWNRWRMSRATERVRQDPAGLKPSKEAEGSWTPLSRYRFGFATLAFALVASLWLPTRLLQEANPEWRAVSWLLALQAAGLSLLGIYLAGGWSPVRRFAFPIMFFLVAVPWPRPIETRVVHSLSRADAAMTAEVLLWMGIPALQRGNVLEVSTGVVGVDDACSGIRSLQSSLMIALFLGELYRLSAGGRALLLPAGIVLAFVFNVCRTLVLAWVAATRGIAAISGWHDPAGFVVMTGSFLGQWGLGLMLKRHCARSGETRSVANGLADQETRPAKPAISASDQLVAAPPCESRSRRSACSRVFQAWPRPFVMPSLVLAGWLAGVEVTTPIWYATLESNRSEGPRWSLEWPAGDPSYQRNELSPRLHRALKLDRGWQGEWREADGSRWQINYLEWLPGKRAAYHAKRHTPEACLPSVGFRLESASPLVFLQVHGIPFPFQRYLFRQGVEPVHVFYCRWEDGAKPESYRAERLTFYNLIRGVWAGRGNSGQKVLELAVWGIDEPETAQATVASRLQDLIRIEAPATTSQAN